MKILAVSARVDPGKALNALLDSPLFFACDRAFLFAAAARAIAKEVAEQVRKHDDAWLADAEKFLLGDSHSRPQRPQRDRRLARLSVITNDDPEVFAPVAVRARGLEIAGPRVLIALPEPRDIAAAERTNADVWLTSREGAVAHEHHHAIAPPDLKTHNEILCVSLTERELKVARAPLDASAWDDLAWSELPLRSRSRLRSQG